VQDLLTLSRFDSGRSDLKLARFSYHAAVQDLYNAVYMEAQRHNHTLSLELEEDLPDIVADRERVVQVRRAVDACLTTQERLVICMRYGLEGYRPCRQREVAEKTGISRSYVSRIEKKALQKLRKALEP
jgi:RNA polymerase sigma factor (sigma-70 family)